MRKLKCPKCGSDCYVWCEGDITSALLDEIDKEFPIYCINDCGIVGTIKGKITLNQNTISKLRTEVKMSENIESKKIMDDIEKLIQNYIDTAKKQNKTPTRDEIMETVTDKLEELLEAYFENLEMMCILSGMALGIAIVLQMEEKLKMSE